MTTKAMAKPVPKIEYTVKEMQEILKQNEVSFTTKMRAAELFKLVKKVLSKKKEQKPEVPQKGEY